MPPSLITAAAAGAAAGKNPWLPFGVLFLLAIFARVPSFLIEPGLHRGLHEMVAPEVFLGLAAVFLTLAVLDSFADKVQWIECWLTPLSAAWRPFAAVGVSLLIAHSAAAGEDLELLRSAAGGEGGAVGCMAFSPESLAMVLPSLDGWRPDAVTGSLAGGALFALTLLVGTVFGLLATVGKIGTRLLLTFVPVPHLKLAHSLLDDVFAFCVTAAGLLLQDGPGAWVATAAGALYLAVGLVVGPTLARLTFIQFRTAWGLLEKAHRHVSGERLAALPPPPWLRRWLAAQDQEVTRAIVLPAYTHRAAGMGHFRPGQLVFLPTGIWFVARGLWRPRALVVKSERIARLGYAESATLRQLVVVEWAASSRPREHVFALFPALSAEVEAVLARGAEVARLARVRPRSPSARRGLPGALGIPLGGRYVAAAAAGRLELQGATTVVAAGVLGLLTVGVFVPIGAGYLLSPFQRRFWLGLAVSGYLSLLALTGAGWPIAVFYGILLNVVALRDLARQAIKAKVDGYVDRWAFLPPVCTVVFVPEALVVSEDDRGDGEAPASVGDGPWRVVARALRREAREAEVATGPAGDARAR